MGQTSEESEERGRRDKKEGHYLRMDRGAISFLQRGEAAMADVSPVIPQPVIHLEFKMRAGREKFFFYRE